MRTWGPDGVTVSTVSGPHLMFYAPNVTAADIGASADGSKSLPFVVQEGVAEQTFIIQLTGETERRTIVATERKLLDDLCAYRNVLCLRRRALDRS